MSGSDASSSLVSGILPTFDASTNYGYGVPLGSKTKAFARKHIGRIMIGHYNGSSSVVTSLLQLESGTLKLSGELGAVLTLKSSLIPFSIPQLNLIVKIVVRLL